MSIATHPQSSYTMRGPLKVAWTGIDKDGAHREFVRKDLVPPISRSSEFRYDNGPVRSGWAVGCTKARPSTVPAGVGRSYELKTDHMRIYQPAPDPSLNISAGPSDRLKYSRNSESKKETAWKPYPHLRSNDVGGKCNVYNPISHTVTSYVLRDSSTVKCIGSVPGTVPEQSILNKGTFNRVKGTTEFADLTRNTHPKENHDHRSAIQNDPRVFYRKKGVFSHMYEACSRSKSKFPFDR
eukprot:GILI01008852.1.p1 GENE.GILI01008852.1~~GILI01008852.1.p1  ORF type:complete len:239 (-),score=31.64 GILI01008852.1:117-833(-)